MKRTDWLAIALIIVPQLFLFPITPAPTLEQLREPTYLALLSTWTVTAILVVWRIAGWSVAFEQLQLALFLFGMPVVYTICALLHGTTLDAVVEASAIPVFGLLALIGHRRKPWILGTAIISHGIVWDVWHYRRSAYIPDWYSMGCLVVDLAFGLYALLLVPRLAASAGMRDSNQQRATA